MYRSLQSVTEDSQSRGCGHIYPDYTASTITNCHEKKANNPLSARCSSVSCCAGISVQFSNNHACLLSPFALSMYPTITTQRLRCSGSATGIVFGMYVTDPILNFVCNNRCMYTTVYGVFFCYNRQQQHAVSVISTVSREDSSSTNLQK